MNSYHSFPTISTQSPRPGYLLAFVLLLLATGCNTDPIARKQKFLDRGNRDFDQHKYAEALISYGRALQVDPQSPEAHYKLAETHVKMGSWAAAVRELQRTVDLQPDHWRAQLNLAQLELAGGK